jgi:hypothetical protein
VLGEHDTLQTGRELLLRRRVLDRRGVDEHGFGLADRVPERHEVVLLERPAGADDVRDQVRDAELDGDLHRAVEPDDLGLDAVLLQVRLHERLVRRREPLALDVGELPVGAPGARVAERRPAEPEGQARLHVRAGVAHQVEAGDAEVQPAGADVDRDVLGAQEEELDAVGRVDDGEVALLVALAVARLPQHFGGALGERALVRNCHAQHGGSPLTGTCRCRPR